MTTINSVHNFFATTGARLCLRADLMAPGSSAAKLVSYTRMQKQVLFAASTSRDRFEPSYPSLSDRIEVSAHQQRGSKPPAEPQSHASTTRCALRPCQQRLYEPILTQRPVACLIASTKKQMVMSHDIRHHVHLASPISQPYRCSSYTFSVVRRRCGM